MIEATSLSSHAIALAPDETATADHAHGAVRLVRSFIAILSLDHGRAASARPLLQPLPSWDPTHRISADGMAEFAYIDAEPSGKTTFSSTGKLTVIVGDDAEWEETQGQQCMGNAACVQWDPTRGSISILSSIVGMPAIFVCRMPRMVVVTSELYLLHAVAQLRLALDPQSVFELFWFGYPLGHRTLFNNVSVMPGAHCLQLDVRGRDTLTRSWTPPEPEIWADLSSQVGLEVEAFRRAVTNLRLKTSLFALTGGLDTRAVLAVLSETTEKPIACTISGGPALCLDARLARALCREYQLQHILITLGDQFVRDLPGYVLEASRLSGGLASLAQAHEVYFYRQLKDLGSRRLSGNLGNQLGRLGVEGTSLRKAALGVLHEELSMAASVEPREHWLESVTRYSGSTPSQLLLECEAPFSSIGNFSIGHHFMIQQTPYANRRLVEIVLRSHVHSGASKRFRPGRARLRDLRHRFLGQARGRSFQCKVIRAVGGAAAHWPINWGWRATGGVSLGGLGWGILAFADAASTTRYLSSELIRRMLAALGASGLHEITQSRLWLDTVLREFVNDTLRSRSVTESGLFSVAPLVRMLDEHYRGVSPHHTTIVAMLDVALAHQVFSASPIGKRSCHIA